VDAWASGTLNRSGTFDYPLRFALSDPVAQNGYSDAGNLPSQQQQNRFNTIPPYINNTTAAAIPTRPWVENLVWCHQKLAFKSGDYFVRYQDSQQLLILERGARAIVAINNDGSAWHDAWIST